MTKKEILLIVFLLLISLVRFLFFIPSKPPFDSLVGKEVKINGIVKDYPDERVFNKRLIIKGENIESNILVIAPKNIEVFYGDEISVTGILESPENFLTSSGKEFNYKQYLSNQNIYFILKAKDVITLSKGNGNFILKNLYKLRSAFNKNIERVVLSPQSDLARGLILGERGGFDNETKDDFVNTGTIHIVALSGYNITIVSESVVKIFGIFLSRMLSIIFGVVVILLFVLMTGASATAIRAGIMATIVLFSKWTGRQYDAGRALLIAALLMIAYDPRIITDISFQLSFLATGGLLFITPKISGHLTFLPLRYKIRELVSSTIGATIAVLPIILNSTGVFSLVSLPANILILPLIPITMFFSFLVGLLGFVSPGLSFLVSYISNFFLSYILKAVQFFADLPFASFNIKSFPLILILIIYIFLLWWVFGKNKSQNATL